MRLLVPCESCRRHVRAIEKVCPFCAVDLAAPPIPTPARSITKLTRAALFAGAALLAPGCSEKKPDPASDEPTPAEKKPHDATPDVAAQPIDAAAPVVADAAPPDAAVKKKKRKKKKKTEEVKKAPDLKDFPPVDPPYGAPPSPDDYLV